MIINNKKIKQLSYQIHPLFLPSGIFLLGLFSWSTPYFFFIEQIKTIIINHI